VSGAHAELLDEVAATDKRRVVFDFIRPYVISYLQLIIRANETLKLGTAADLTVAQSPAAKAAQSSNRRSTGHWRS